MKAMDDFKETIVFRIINKQCNGFPLLDSKPSHSQTVHAFHPVWTQEISYIETSFIFLGSIDVGKMGEEYSFSPFTGDFATYVARNSSPLITLSIACTMLYKGPYP
mmetsp:Transcript_1404/g.1882  ORF Transcript_1404/g.1882 Transcript_1404/m.1882 type:complete len:106 (-) Transcript_1404:102-419(-)